MTTPESEAARIAMENLQKAVDALIRVNSAKLQRRIYIRESLLLPHDPPLYFVEVEGLSSSLKSKQDAISIVEDICNGNFYYAGEIK